MEVVHLFSKHFEVSNFVKRGLWELGWCLYCQWQRSFFIVIMWADTAILPGVWTGFLQWPSTSFFVIPLKSSRPPMSSTIVCNKHPTYDSGDICNLYWKHTGVPLVTTEVWNCNSDIFVYAEWCVHMMWQHILSISKLKSNSCLCSVSPQLDQYILFSGKVQEAYFKSAHIKEITTSNGLFNHVTKVMFCKNKGILFSATATCVGS